VPSRGNMHHEGHVRVLTAEPVRIYSATQSEPKTSGDAGAESARQPES
jgi:hypothetical protein